jgi:hypothetical protein
MPGTTTIYDPPKEGLPYLVVTFAPEGMKITATHSSLAARTIASERAIRRRSRARDACKALNVDDDGLQAPQGEFAAPGQLPGAEGGDLCPSAQPPPRSCG